MKKKENPKKNDSLKEKSQKFIDYLAEVVKNIVAFEKAVNERSKIVPVTPEEQRVMDQVNLRLGKGDKGGALQLLDSAFAKGVIPSVRYYQIRNSITSVDMTSFFH
jgi:hypothetical protein